jgi:hypothetical protein
MNSHETHSTLEFIEAEIQARINSFKQKVEFNRKWASRAILFTASLSATTTVLIGLNQSSNNLKILSAIALITSASITVVNAWDGVYQYRRRWVQYSGTLMRLKGLKFDIEYAKIKLGDNLSLEAVDQFKEIYQNILRDANEGWKEDRLKTLKEN